MLLVVNLFGGAGCGKSTTATGVFHQLKKQDINCELVTEYAKDLVWSESLNVLNDQLKLLGEQNHRFWRLRKKVDVIITDSPILNSILYNTSYSDTLDLLTLEIFNDYTNMNYVIERTKKFNPMGRLGTEGEAIKMDAKVIQLLKDTDQEYSIVSYDYAVPIIVNDVTRKLRRML